MATKKVALCISGLVRGYEVAYKNLYDNLINYNKEYDFDVFLDIWDVRNSKNSEMFLRGNIDSRECYDDFNKVDINNIIEYYNPVSINVDKIEKCDFLFTKKYNNIGNNPISVFSQFYKIKKCGESLFNYINTNTLEYDLVIKSRFDLKMNPINLNLINNTENNIFVEQDGCPSNWTSDKLSVSNLEVYKVYHKFYDKLPDLIKFMGTTIPEYLLFKYLSDNNINILKTDTIGRLGLF